MSVAPSYFFELLTEEIPAWMLEERLRILKEKLVETVRDYSGEDPDPTSITVDATSRRIVFHITDLVERQPDREAELKGPPAKIAWDKDGKPTRALEGFLRKNSATIDSVENRDGYVWLERRIEGKKAIEFLPERIPPINGTIRSK